MANPSGPSEMKFSHRRRENAEWVYEIHSSAKHKRKGAAVAAGFARGHFTRRENEGFQDERQGCREEDGVSQGWRIRPVRQKS